MEQGKQGYGLVRFRRTVAEVRRLLHQFERVLPGKSVADGTACGGFRCFRRSQATHE